MICMLTVPLRESVVRGSAAQTVDDEPPAFDLDLSLICANLRDCAYANEFPFQAWVLDVVSLRNFISSNKVHFWEEEKEVQWALDL